MPSTPGRAWLLRLVIAFSFAQGAVSMARPAVYVLVGMAKVEFGDHTRFTVKWAALTSLVVLAAGMLFGII